MSAYDPFVRGRLPVGVRAFEARDAARGRAFPCEVWYPAAARHAGEDTAAATQDSFAVPLSDAPRTQAAVRDAEARAGLYPLVLYSHSSGGGRRAATFLCTHLVSHGYVVAALDHSELVAPELARRQDETEARKAERVEAWMANRVPDVRLLLDFMSGGEMLGSEVKLDAARVGVVGHSFGGWTALAAVEVEPRIRSVVAHAPAGSSRIKPGMIPARLEFAWGRDVPTLYLVAETDVSLPLEGMRELFERTPATKRMVVLRRADHMHFMDDAARLHEAVRAMSFPGELAWLPREMRPMAELCTEEQAHLFTRGLTLCHLDATLRDVEEARRLLDGDLEAELAARGVEAFVDNP